MLLKDINEILNKAELPSALFLFGEEEFLIDETLNKVLDKFCPNRVEDYNFRKFNADELTVAELLDQANAFPMLGDNQTIVIKNFEKYFSGRTAKSDKRPEQLRKYLSNPQPTTKLIITCNDKSLFGLTKKGNAKIKEPYSSMLDLCESIEFPKLWPSDYPNWIKQRFNEVGKTITEKSIKLIISQTQESLRDISNQIEKIITYLPEATEVDSDEIIELVGQSKDYNVFELQKSVAYRDLSKALYIGDNMLNSSRQEIYIISVLSNYFTSVFRLIEARSKSSSKYELASMIGTNPYFLNDYLIALDKYSYEEIEKVFLYLKDADHQLKTTSVDGKVVISKLLNLILGR